MTALATERIVTLVSPREKKAFEAKARKLGFKSVGELIRRSVEAYNPELEELEERAAEIDALLKILAESNKQANKALDEAEAEFRITRAYFDSKRKGPASGDL